MTSTAAIIGLGNIGMLFDKQPASTESVRSHARALSLHPDFELVGGVDPDPGLRDAFSADYGQAAYPDINGLLADHAPEVLVIASPTRTHGQLINTVLQRYRPSAILCEKPLAYASVEARQLVEACKERGVRLFVNYVRRADPGVREVKSRLEDGRIATPLKAVVWYSKGLLHNGSHFADLLAFWLGSATGVKLIEAGRPLGEDDAEPDFSIRFAKGAAVFCAAREEDYSHYTVELIAPNGRLRYEQDGSITWQRAGAHPELAGFRRLEPAPASIANDMGRYQYHVAEQLSLALRDRPSTLCAGSQALETLELLEGILGHRNKASCADHG